MFRKLTTSFSVFPTGIPEPNPRYTFSVHTKFKNYPCLLEGVLSRQLIPHKHLQCRLVLHLTVTKVMSILGVSASLYENTTCGQTAAMLAHKPRSPNRSLDSKVNKTQQLCLLMENTLQMCNIYAPLRIQINEHQIFKAMDHCFSDLDKKSHKILPMKLSILSSNLMSSFLQVLFAHLPPQTHRFQEEITPKEL